MDEVVRRALARWPAVPDVYGWLALDRRGEWRLQAERIANAALRDFIARNYAADAAGRWYFQNGPQRVFVALEYAPLVARFDGRALSDQCGEPVDAAAPMWLDEEGALLLATGRGLALLDDRDLAAFAAGREEALARLPRLARNELPGRFGFVRNPVPSG
jgi:hypothetical protein